MKAEFKNIDEIIIRKDSSDKAESILFDKFIKNYGKKQLSIEPKTQDNKDSPYSYMWGLFNLSWVDSSDDNLIEEGYRRALEFLMTQHRNHKVNSMGSNNIETQKFDDGYKAAINDLMKLIGTD